MCRPYHPSTQSFDFLIPARATKAESFIKHGTNITTHRGLVRCVSSNPCVGTMVAPTLGYRPPCSRVCGRIIATCRKETPLIVMLEADPAFYGQPCRYDWKIFQSQCLLLGELLSIPIGNQYHPHSRGVRKAGRFRHKKGGHHWW